jgi:hypothetical protein
MEMLIAINAALLAHGRDVLVFCHHMEGTSLS